MRDIAEETGRCGQSLGHLSVDICGPCNPWSPTSIADDMERDGNRIVTLFIKAPPALASTSQRELTRSLVEGAPLLHQQNIHSKSHKKQAVVLVSIQCNCCGVAIVFSMILALMAS